MQQWMKYKETERSSFDTDEHTSAHLKIKMYVFLYGSNNTPATFYHLPSKLRTTNQKYMNYLFNVKDKK